MIAFPPCKINLGLNIHSRREDGFHELETCFYPVPWTDILEIIPSPKLELTCSGNNITGNPNENLCMKAYQLLQSEFNIPAVHIHLHKIIPMGAGLGGGSADAAHTLRLLNDVFRLHLPIDRLKSYASKLGSDCSFFIHDSPMIGEGRGERLTPASVNLKGLQLILVKPDVHISTAEAYARIIPKTPQLKIKDIIQQPIADWKGRLKNDFEESIFASHSSIEKIKLTLYSQGALYASMSGSGSAVFGLFDRPVQLKNHFTGMDYWEGKLN